MNDARRAAVGPLSECRELPGAERPGYAGERKTIFMRVPGRGRAQPREKATAPTLTHLTRYFRSGLS